MTLVWKSKSSMIGYPLFFLARRLQVSSQFRRMGAVLAIFNIYPAAWCALIHCANQPRCGLTPAHLLPGFLFLSGAFRGHEFHLTDSREFRHAC